ncbi:hypothetical protein [Pseudoalteromonas marina]|uniref:Uncharacterized protein n=1 Tax=Pseudoalteromonas marina TaxID=267375 RepID=A0ABT9FGA2_9GAMM|nr:hypothetical protein [Pseudoalteromonas marina]MDP2565807.1 hypothetical protein [Pseudoalteromonas marina]
MIKDEIRVAVNNLLTLLEKHNTPGFVLIPEPHNPLYGEIAFKENKLHDYLRDVMTTAAMKDQYSRISVLQDNNELITALKTYKDIDVNFEKNVRSVFTEKGCTDEFISSILIHVLKEDKIDRTLDKRRKNKKLSAK